VEDIVQKIFPFPDESFKSKNHQKTKDIYFSQTNLD